MSNIQNANSADGPVQTEKIDKVVQFFGDYYEIDGKKIKIDRQGISHKKNIDELKHSLTQNRKQLNNKEREIEQVAEKVGSIELNNVLYTAVLNVIMYAVNIRELVEAITYEGGEEELKPNEAFPEEELNTRIERGFSKYRYRKDQEKKENERKERERKEREREEQLERERREKARKEQLERERRKREREEQEQSQKDAKAGFGIIGGLILGIVATCFFILFQQFKWFYGIMLGSIIGAVFGAICYFIYRSILGKLSIVILCFTA